MGTQEIYIRNANETEARGPFTAQQLTDLAEVGQVSPATLIYDAITEQWVELGSNPALMNAVYPPKKKLAFKGTKVTNLNKTTSDTRPISVDDMLAAAEGRTSDTKDKADPEIAMARAARVGMWGLVLALVLAAGGEILPGSAALMSMEGEQLISQPLVILGVVDLALAVLLALGMTTLYPFVRFRAALGVGLVGFMLYAQGQQSVLPYVVAGHVGLYCCTLFTNLFLTLPAVLGAVGGMGLLSWFLLNY
ncbi:MAG: GYF domain-containing protein [Verrucomicrobiota bacterium]|jgi:hypothetical protein